jgi:hypothetical protein
LLIDLSQQPKIPSDTLSMFLLIKSAHSTRMILSSTLPSKFPPFLFCPFPEAANSFPLVQPKSLAKSFFNFFVFIPFISS